MGGYVVPMQDLQKEIEWYLQQDRIVMLLEPCSPFDNSYNVNTLFQTPTMVTLEIVGPGFDASDLQRGHLSPHEVIEIELGTLHYQVPITREILEESITKRDRIGEHAYPASVRRRLWKIHRKFILKEKFFSANADLPDDEALSSVRQMLRTTGHTNLLEHERRYTPITADLLSQTVTLLKSFPRKYSRHYSLKYPFVLAASYVNRGEKLVFWDVVVPSRKFVPTK